MKYDLAACQISTDPTLLDIDAIHSFLSTQAYWSLGRSRATVVAAIEASLNFGLYCKGSTGGQKPGSSEMRQESLSNLDLSGGATMLGYARVVSDYCTIFYLADVFLIPEARGQGLGRYLVASILEHPRLRNLNGLLLTKDAQDLYAEFGFVETDVLDRKAMLRRAKS